MAKETDAAIGEEGGVPEKAGGAGGAARAPLLSPAGWFIILIVMAVEGALVFMAARHFQQPAAEPAGGAGPKVAAPEAPGKVGPIKVLEDVSAQLFDGPQGKVSATIVFRFVLEVTPDLPEEQAKAVEEWFKNRLVEAEIASVLRGQEFMQIQQKSFPEQVAKKVLDHLNQSMGPRIRSVKVLDFRVEMP